MTAELVLMLGLAASAMYALLSRFILQPLQKEIVLSEAQMRLMHIDPNNHPGFKGPLASSRLVSHFSHLTIPLFALKLTFRFS